MYAKAHKHRQLKHMCMWMHTCTLVSCCAAPVPRRLSPTEGRTGTTLLPEHFRYSHAIITHTPDTTPAKT